MKAQKQVTVEVEFAVQIADEFGKTVYTNQSVVRERVAKVELFNPFGQQKSAKDIAASVIDNAGGLTSYGKMNYKTSYTIVRCTILP